MFTDPPLGRVGMTEPRPSIRTRGQQGDNSDVRGHGSALDGETDGLVNILVDTETERFLGASVLGITGDEIVQIVSALMHADELSITCWPTCCRSTRRWPSSIPPSSEVFEPLG